LTAPQAVVGLGPRRPRRATLLTAPQAVVGLGPRRPRRATLATSSGPARGRRREPRQRTPPECRAARPSAGENPSAAGRGL